MSKYHILLVEDQLIIQEITRNMLARLDCEVTVVEDGQLAVEQFQQGRYDLIFMDLGLPTIGGFEVTQQIRTLEQKNNLTPTPIIALTGHDTKEHRMKAADVGMDGFIAKPLTSDTALFLFEEHIVNKRGSSYSSK